VAQAGVRQPVVATAIIRSCLIAIRSISFKRGDVLGVLGGFRDRDH